MDKMLDCEARFLDIVGEEKRTPGMGRDKATDSEKQGQSRVAAACGSDERASVICCGAYCSEVCDCV